MSSTFMPARAPVKASSLTGSRRLSVSRSASLRSGAAMTAAWPRTQGKKQPGRTARQCQSAGEFVRLSSPALRLVENVEHALRVRHAHGRSDVFELERLLQCHVEAPDLGEL